MQSIWLPTAMTLIIDTCNSPVQRKQNYAWNVELLGRLNVTSHPESFFDSTFVQESMGKI